MTGVYKTGPYEAGFYSDITIMFQVFKPEKDHRYHERYVALCLFLPTHGIKCWHLKHSSNGWKFDPEENEERETSRTVVGSVIVAVLPPSIAMEETIISTISQTRIRNGLAETEWASRHWVGDALSRLYERGCINADQLDKSKKQLDSVAVKGAEV